MDQNQAGAPGVRHDEAGGRFEIRVGAHVAHLDYEWQGEKVVITHTFVPIELRGRGLAGQLARAALDWTRLRGARVVPACSYVARFIERHEEYRVLLG